MDGLSVEAKVMLGGFWNLMITDQLTFHRPHIIHPRSRKGLDELVDTGYLTVEPFNKHGGLVWKPTEKLRTERPRVSRKFMEENSFPLTEDQPHE